MTPWAFVAATFLGGAVLCVLAWQRVDSASAALSFAVATGLAQALSAQMRRGIYVGLSSVVILTAVLVGGWPLAAVAAMGAPFGMWSKYQTQHVKKTLFNFGQMVLSAFLAGGFFVLVGGRVGEPAHAYSWVVLLVAAAVFTAVNHGLIALVLNLETGEHIRSTISSVMSSSLLLEIPYAALAILAAALLIETGVGSLAFLVVPALIARHALLSHERQNSAYDRLVDALLMAIEVKDGYTRGHTERVATLCLQVGREFDFDYGELRAMRYAAKLHDVGKLGVPLSIINKPGKLDNSEFAKIMEHPRIGTEILGGIDFLQPILHGVLHHHERVDGDGYPAGLEGDDVPLVARIITVCDAFDAMTSTRPYRQAMSVEAAFAELDRCAGKQFDPQVVDTLKAVAERLEWEPTYDAYVETDRETLLEGVQI